MRRGHSIDYSTVKGLKRRLACHKRRMTYWSGNPSFTGFGPTGKKLMGGYMDDQYSLACEDAMSIAGLLERKGESVTVVDVRATFRGRWNNPDAPEVLLYPQP